MIKSLENTVSEEQIVLLNEKYKTLKPNDRVIELYNDFTVNEVMLTSSFAATSALLLKLFSDINKKQKIHFIDTGYHFKETLIYKEYLTQLYELNVEDIKAEDYKHDFTNREKTWVKDPNMCCSINKVEPLDLLKKDFKVWVSGLMSWQSDHRSTLNIFEKRGDILKFYPLLDVTKDERHEFISSHHLPFHPLIGRGYSSIGCTHCTKPGENRAGRWNNSPKTECGLHL